MEFFDLHTTGIGYASRLREVKPRGGKPFWAVTINALIGAKDPEHRQYTRFDCRIVSDQALQAVRAAEEAIALRKAVLIGFRIGDIYPDAWTAPGKDGEPRSGVVIKGRLIKVQFVRVDGQDLPLPGQEQSPQEMEPAQGNEQRFDPKAWFDAVAVRSQTHCVVKLGREEEYFDLKRGYLKEQGFFFDRKTLSWRREIEHMVHNG